MQIEHTTQAAGNATGGIATVEAVDSLGEAADFLHALEMATGSLKTDDGAAVARILDLAIDRVNAARKLLRSLEGNADAR